MADDLMDFSEAESQNCLVAEQDENDTPVVPGLVQSPVIVNSILKQSSKDNLIQLYTPVQKPEKGRLKVRFGHDSMLQTPNVNQMKKKMGEASVIKEEGENTTKGVKFAEEDKENISGEVQSTDVTAKVERDADTVDSLAQHASGEADHTAVKDEATSSTESCLELSAMEVSAMEVSAMEVSVCETQTSEKALDPAADILLQAEMLLRSLQGGGPEITVTAPVESSEQSEVVDEVVKKAGSEEKAEEKVSDTVVGSECDFAQDTDSNVAVKEECVPANKSGDVIAKIENNGANENTEIALSNKECETGGASSNDGEPLRCEEAMEFEEEDDEIVFNIGKKKSEEISPEGTEGNVVAQIVKTVEEKTVKEETVSEASSESNVETDESNCKNIDDSLSSKNNEIKTAQDLLNSVDAKNEVSYEEEKNLNLDKCIGESLETSEIKGESQTAADAQEIVPDVKDGQTELTRSKGADSLKTEEDSSDEEFMSAGEDMEVDEVRTPAKPLTDSNIQQDTNPEPKEESPERIPPKMGYNLNFDDLDALDPFATKKSLVNSPDVGKQSKQEVKVDEDSNEKVSAVNVDSNNFVSEQIDGKGDKNEQFKSANTSPEKSAPPRAEIILSPNAALVDEVCRDKTAGDIFAERPDCLLPDNPNQINQSESLLHKEMGSSELKALESEVKKEIDFDNMDPFKSKAQIANTPDKVKKEGVAQLNVEDPFKASNQIMNTPEVKDTHKDSQVESFNTVKTEDADVPKQTVDQQMTDNDIPVTPQKEVTEEKKLEDSPALPVSRGTYDLDALDLDDIDPFKPKKQMTNSPSITSGQNKTDDIDPFKPKTQIQNSPIADKCNSEVKPGEVDPFKPKKQIVNSPVSQREVTEIAENTNDANLDKTVDDATDTFKPKSPIQNLPAKQVENLSVEENDPLKSNSQVQNSPSSKMVADVNSQNFESLDDIDPFKPKLQIQNSPAGKVDDINTLEMENFDSIDPFKSKTQLQNSPPGKVTLVEPDLDTLDDPFKPKNQVQNSPLIKNPKSVKDETEPEKTNITGITADKIENNIDPCADEEPLKSRKQLNMSPPTKSQGKIDPFADLNPFETKRKIANTPEKVETTNEDQGLDDFADIDPFNSKSKIANSPELETIEENPFVTKSRVATTPTKQEDLFSERVELPTTPLKELEGSASELGDIFEVQGVTRRGQEMSEAGKFGDIDESEFVPASQVFNDPAAWEMLEKLGNATTDTAESALSRMSLYVKFDPLVDEAPAVNPRRISIRVSQLEKVKEYGLDETLLLLGTPPKKRRQSVIASQARATPSEIKSATSAGALHPNRKAEPVAAAPGAVDLILAYSPKEKEQQESSYKADAPVMALLDDVDTPEESENLFQELKYTDADLKRIQRDNKLAMQGLLINKDKEWCKREKQWEQKNAELAKKCKQIKEDRDKLEQAFLSMEATVYQIAAARDTTEKKVKELTNEKEQAFQDIQEVEKAFADLHRRYEKAKNMIMSMKKNEETLKKHATEGQDKLKKMNEKFHAFEKSSQEKLAANKVEIEKLEQQRDSVQSKFDAQMKITQMKIENLETSLQRKTDENKQLTEICDNLLAKVGQ